MESALDLVKLADKYSYFELKEYCEEFLRDKLSFENFVSIGKVAKFIELPLVEISLIKFALRNPKTLEEKGVAFEKPTSKGEGLFSRLKLP